MSQTLKDYEKDTNYWYIHQYLLHGSVEKVYQQYRWDINIPIASYHRLVNRYGIVKSSGRRDVSLSELLHFFKHILMEPTLKLETVYNQKMPPSFQTSVSTLHRTYQNTINNKHTRIATALIIHPNNDLNSVLVGQEVQTARRLGKHMGDLSLPMTFSGDNDSNRESVLRVLQQEVLSGLAIKGKLSINSKVVKDIAPPDLMPIFNFYILDVCVKVYELYLPANIKKLNAVKLNNLQFVKLETASKLGNFRTGILDLLDKYRYLHTSAQSYPMFISTLNQSLVELSI